MGHISETPAETGPTALRIAAVVRDVLHVRGALDHADPNRFAAVFGAMRLGRLLHLRLRRRARLAEQRAFDRHFKTDLLGRFAQNRQIGRAAFRASRQKPGQHDDRNCGHPQVGPGRPDSRTLPNTVRVTVMTGGEGRNHAQTLNKSLSKPRTMPLNSCTLRAASKVPSTKIESLLCISCRMEIRSPGIPKITSHAAERPGRRTA